MVSKAVQSLKAPQPIFETDEPMVKEERLEQLANASYPIKVQRLGMIRSPERLVHPQKAYRGIELRFSGNSTPVRPKHCEKQFSPMLISDSGNVKTPLRPEQP